MAPDAKPPFVGRRDELKRWDEVLRNREGQAVLVVGQQGMGKTVLVDKMAELAGDHPDLACGEVRYEVTPTDAPDGTMELMLDHSFRAARVTAGSLDGTEQRVRQWKALFDILPKGKELRELVGSLRSNPERATREQFIERLELISSRMPEHGRAVFVIDPEKYMPEGSADTWRLVAGRLPAKIKLVFAQRNDGRLAGDGEFLALDSLVRIPGGDLDVLDEAAIEHLLEIFLPKIDHPPEAVRDAVAAYDRHPYAVPAALGLLADGADLESLPGDPTPTGVATQQWKHVCRRGPDAIGLLRAYAILEVAVPDSVVRSVADIASAAWEHLRSDDYLSGLTRGEGRGRRIYHSLLADHILHTLPDDDAARLHGRAVDEYRRLLTADDKPNELAASRLPEHVLAAEGEKAFVRSFVNESAELLRILGLLETYESLSKRALATVEPGSKWEGVLLSNLGLIYRTRGYLDQAEEVLHKAIKIDERLGLQEGMGTHYGNLSAIYWTRGDLERAEEMLCKGIEINERLGRQEGGIAAQYGNLGLIYRTRGDLVQAERMHRKSLEIHERLGLQEGMAAQYSNLSAIYWTRGDLERAEGILRKAIEIDESLGRQEGMAIQYGNLGLIYKTRGDLDRAEEMLRESLEINRRLVLQEGMANQYTNLGEIARLRNDFPAARRLWTDARDLYERIGMPHMVKQLEDWLDSLPPEDGPETE